MNLIYNVLKWRALPAVKTGLAVLSVVLILLAAGANPPAGSPAGYLDSLFASYYQADQFFNDPVVLLSRFGEPKKAYEQYIRRSGPQPDRRDLMAEARLLTELGLYERADSVLGRIESETGASLDLWRARLNFLAGRYELALGGLREISSSVTGEYSRRLRIETLLSLGRLDSAFAEARPLLGREPADPEEVRFHELLLDSYASADSLEVALQIAGDLSKLRLPGKTAARIKQKEIDLLYQAGEPAAAAENIHRLVKKYSGEPGTVEVILRLLDRTPAENIDPGKLLLYCRGLLDGGRKNEAKAILAPLRHRQLSAAQHENRKILWAQIYYQEKKFSQAAEMARLTYANASYKRLSILILARCYRQMGRPLSAASLYTNFATTFPSDAKAAEALYVASRLYQRTNHQTKSREILEKLAARYRSSYFGKMAALQLTWSYNQRKQYDRSVAVLKRLIGNSKWGNEAAWYYLADTYRQAGQPDKQADALVELAKRDSTSFYLHPRIESVPALPLMSSSGSVALEGESGLVHFLSVIAGRKRTAQETIGAALTESGGIRGEAEAARYLRQGRYFLEAGFRDLAVSELKQVEPLISASPPTVFKLAILYDNHGFAWESVRLYRKVWDTIHGPLRHQLAPFFQLLLYPLPFPVQVFENCAREGLDPHFVYAIIREESKFDLTAVSRAGAQGLMQLMPTTGKHVARKLDLPDKVSENLLVPEINLAFGIWYASYLLRRCGDDRLMMLAAYNAGMTNAKRWFRSGRNIPVPRQIDGIPYKETRNYVKRIVESARIYHHLYFCIDHPCSVSKR